ncbi:alpha/beta hydrolase [Aquincola sp. S2]|uniref:Alpha/beta hydrolase n=1 Tax=Pseudaquabacterium terrae TaxID=2732868 RepID=A0ABX2EVD0_9BURK|nr:alpha/beta hydrolase [Aquabacterium terrae]NRF72384.1 alpha/beta hydrolase [Aquabacterium terrae]
MGNWLDRCRKLLLRLLLRALLKPLWRRLAGPEGIRRLRAHAARADRWVGGGRDAAVQSVQLEGVAGCWIGDAAAAQHGVLLYLHGGGFCVHMPATYRALGAALQQRTGLRVLLPDYRLAPEHPYPAGLDDVERVYTALLANAVADGPAEGLDPRRCCIAGDSAGGALALALLQRLRDRGLPLPACAVLLSPVTDLCGGSPSWQRNERSDWMFTLAAQPLLCEAYAPGRDLADPGLSPLLGHWHGLPPLAFHVSSSEMLLDDSVRAVERARAAGVAAELRIWPDLPHVFQVALSLRDAQRSLDEIGHFIARHLKASP